jgi:hypothetical protein
MPHEIHVSERRSFRGCRKRWNWAYREGFVPDSPIKALEFGIAYHSAMEAFYNPETWDALTAEQRLGQAIEVFNRECDQQAQKYLTANHLQELPLEQEQDFIERLELGEGMLTYYATYIHPKMDSWFKPVAVEIPFEVPVMDPDFPNVHLTCTNSPACGQAHENSGPDSYVVYAGRVDMLVEDLRYGGYYIWDHKTAAQMMRDDGFLQLDDQIGSYCWALSHVLQLDICGFIYAECRKDYPREPKLLKRQMGGRAFSTAANQATSLEIFEAHIIKHDAQAYLDGCYDEYIKFLKSAEATQFTQRFIIRKSKAELDSIGKNISMEAADMVDSKTRIYPSVGRYTCSTCAFRRPCLGEFMGEDVQYLLETEYIQTNRRYWMDQPTSSDKGTKS